MPNASSSDQRTPWPGLAVVVAVVTALLTVVLWPSAGDEPAPVSQPIISLPSPDPAGEPEPETVIEYVLPPVCENVITVNEMLVVAAQDTYSQALDAVLGENVGAMKKAAEALDAYRELLTEVAKTYEEDREECMGTRSDSDLLKERAEKLLEDEEEDK